jgi:hypothetical protein
MCGDPVSVASNREKPMTFQSTISTTPIAAPERLRSRRSRRKYFVVVDYSRVSATREELT